MKKGICLIVLLSFVLISCRERMSSFYFDCKINELCYSTTGVHIRGTYEASEDIKYICIIYGREKHFHNAIQKLVMIEENNFEVELSDLYPDSDYYFYFICDVINVEKTSVKTFRTEKVLKPVVSTKLVTDITSTSAVSGGDVLSDGGDDIQARGVCWSVDELPTLNDNYTIDGIGEGSYISEMIGLVPNTTYYVRAYATNSQGTSYGEQRMFNTRSNMQEIEYKTIEVNDVVFNMVRVMGSNYYMGAQSSNQDSINYDADAKIDESPVHSVLLDDFYIGETEVTQELWYAVMGNNPSDFKNPKRPVENISWKDCNEFIKQLNDITGMNFRLSTEAEWEYAARGGKNTSNYIYSGSEMIDDVAWYCGNINSFAMMTQVVGAKIPNELGIYDMTGNLYEWCQDWYASDYYQNSTIDNPTGPLLGETRIIRGGSFFIGAEHCRVSCRYYENPFNKNNNIGLRIAL